MFLSVLRRKFLYFQHEKSYSRKTKIGTIFGSFWKIRRKYLCKKQSHLILIDETNSSHMTNTVCDLMHQYMDGW